MDSIWKIIKTAFSLPVVLVLAWILTHTMAVFGIFAVSAYPIWTIFFPSSSICLGCRSLKPGDKCQLCNQVIDPKNMHPKNPRSVFLNTFVIFVLTLFSVTIVYFESQVIERSGFIKAFKTVSFNIPDKSQYRINEIFPMKIEVNGIATSINVIQADITFDPEILEVIDISTKDSFASIFVQKDVNNNLGYVRLTGGVPNPGYSKETGTFGTIYFKAKTAGLVTVSFLPTSLVLANDGRGTNVLKEFPSSSYVIKPEKISAEEELTQTEIYKSAVLGVTNVIGKNDCRISFITGQVPNVLGASTDSADILVGENKALDKDDDIKRGIFEKVIDFISWFDQWVISLYSKILTKIFTN